MRLPTPLVLAVTALAAASVLLASPAQASSHEVLLVEVEGVVSQGTLLHVRDAIGEAEARGIPLVIQLDTPGGLVDATLEIHKAIVRADVPVLTFVGPRGAFAASAGTFLLLMGHPAGMAPETQIGSAQPITVAPDGSSKEAGEKVENFLVERMREIAARAGRNETIATQFITENRNMDEREALATGMVDAVTSDLRAFLAAVDGRQAIVGDGNVTLHTAGAAIRLYEPSLLSRVVEILSTPQVAFILLLAGMYALIFGLANPGTYVPETIGAILLLLGFVGLGLFDTNTAGVLLMLLALVFFIAEVFTPTHGVLTAAGVAALFFAVLFVLDEPLLPASVLRQFLFVGFVGAVVSGGIVLGAVTVALRARKRPVFGMLEQEEGVVMERLDPDGSVRIAGEIWAATAEGGRVLMEGTRVRVVRRDGLRLRVVAASEGHDAPGATDETEGS